MLFECSCETFFQKEIVSRWCDQCQRRTNCNICQTFHSTACDQNSSIRYVAAPSPYPVPAPCARTEIAVTAICSVGWSVAGVVQLPAPVVSCVLIVVLDAMLHPLYLSRVVRQVELLRKRVFSAVRPKTMYGRPLNGAMISNLAATYAQALNENKAPTISTAWDRVVDKQCQEAVEKALERYMKAMRDAVAQTEPRTWTSAEGKEEMVQVLEAGDVHQTHDGSRQLALDVFKKEAVQDEQRLPPFETALTDGLRERLIKFVRQNEGNSARLCQGVLHQLIDDLRSGLQSSLATMRDAAKAEGGGGGGGDDSAGEGIGFGTVMEQYRMHLERLQETYAKRAGGPAKDSALCAALVEHVPPVLSEAADLVSQGHQRQVRRWSKQCYM